MSQSLSSNYHTQQPQQQQQSRKPPPLAAIGAWGTSDSMQSERRRSILRRDSTFTLSPETSPTAPSRTLPLEAVDLSADSQPYVVLSSLCLVSKFSDLVCVLFCLSVHVAAPGVQPARRSRLSSVWLPSLGE